MKNNGKVRDVCSLVCEIEVLKGRVLGTWKWTIAAVLEPTCTYEYMFQKT